MKGLDVQIWHLLSPKLVDVPEVQPVTTKALLTPAREMMAAMVSFMLVGFWIACFVCVLDGLGLLVALAMLDVEAEIEV